MSRRARIARAEPRPWTLAPRSHGGRLVRALALHVVLALAACEPVAAGPDAGEPGDEDASPTPARAVVRLPRESLDGAGLEVRRFAVSAVSLRLVSDRGEAFDPVRTDLGTLDLARPQMLRLEPVAPASYSAVVLGLAGGTSSVELEVFDSELGLVRVRHEGPLEWMARCSEGVPVRVGEELQIGVSLELDAAWENLREAELPDPVGDRIELDEARDPGLVRTLMQDIGAALRAECGAERG